MDSISDAELKTLLEALHIALRVSVVFPPLEQNRLYTELDELWDRMGNEAIARGLTDYVEYMPDMEGVHRGPALDSDSEVEEVIAFHFNEVFWRKLSSQLALLACERVYGKQFEGLSIEEQVSIRSRFEERAEELFERGGLREVVNLNAILPAPETE